MGRSVDADGSRPTTIESRGGETTRPQKRGKPQPRQEGCVKKGGRKAEEGDNWREIAVNREKWKGAWAGQQYTNYPHPFII